MDIVKYRISILLILFISFSFCLVSCKKDYTDDSFPRNVDVYLRYLAEGNQFSGMCKVTFADTLAIGEPDTANYAITINNKDLKQVIVGNGIKNYTFQTKTPFAHKFEIKMKEPNGDILSKSTKMYSIDSILVNPVVSMSKGMDIQYFGQELSANESIILMLITSDDKSTSTMIQGPASSNTIHLKAEDLQLLPKGMATLYLIRTFNDEEVNGKMHFVIRNEYFSQSKSINLVP